MLFKTIENNLKLLGKTILVEFVDFDKTCEEGRFGRSNLKQGNILIDNTIRNERQEETLLHEVIHHINSDLYLKISEEQTTALSTALYSFLRDNKIIGE